MNNKRKMKKKKKNPMFNTQENWLSVTPRDFSNHCHWLPTKQAGVPEAYEQWLAMYNWITKSSTGF
jgi:hypothetical protein